jgi:tripartite-type tricarboxylate transporter receptor subunit TctC
MGSVVGAFRKSSCRNTGLGAAFVFAAFGAGAAQADDLAAFYKGRTVSIIISSAAGGGYDMYGRLVARNIGKYLPGTPTVVASNMPGAGGNAAASHVANVAAKDGTVVGAVSAGSLLDQLISDKGDQIRHDARKLNYIGSANSEVFTCLVASKSPIQKFEDLYTQEIMLGSSGGTTRDMPLGLKHVLGAKIKLIAGYSGTRDVGLAIERGEVSGICGMGWTSIRSQRPEWFEKNLVRVLVQESSVGTADLNKQNVPLSVSFAKTPEQKAMLDLLYAQGVFTRPFVMAPEVDKAKVEAFRTAFMKALADPVAHQEAEKQKLEITAISGADLSAMVAKIYAQPPEIARKLRAALSAE